MTKKLICISVEKGAPHVVITFNNGVHPDKVGHVSGTVGVDKAFYNAACQNRVLFNKILGIDIREGWQNALKDAISNAKNLSLTNIDAERVARVAAMADVALRGEEAIQADIDKIEKGNQTIADEIEKEVDAKNAKRKGKKSAKTKGKSDAGNETPDAPETKETDETVTKENENDEDVTATGTTDGGDAGSDTSVADAGNETPDELPATESVAGGNV